MASLVLNQQEPALVLAKDTGRTELAVHSIFPTIQGEGPFAGERAIFLRLWGCNLQCPHCDTDYTSELLLVEPETLADLIQRVEANEEASGHFGLVVITGGEPLRQPEGLLKDLALLLLDKGYKVQIETNGTLFSSVVALRGVTVVCSPKTGSVNKLLKHYIDAYKYVLSADDLDSSDGLPIQALGHSARPVLAKPHKGFNGRVYLQPVDVQDEVENRKHLEAVVNSCYRFGYTLCLQLHKLIGKD